MPFAFSLKLKTKGCSIDNQVLNGKVITGLISEKNDVEALINDVLVPVHVQTNGLFVVDISQVILEKGVHSLKVQSTPNDIECEASILVFEDYIIVLNTLNCQELLPFFDGQPPEIIGIVVGFLTDLDQEISPCNCIKPLLDGLSLKKFSIIYGYAIKILECLGKRTITECKDFHEDFMCLGIPREWLNSLCCSLMDILDFPKTKDICIQSECALTIDLSKIVSNHKDSFVYEIVSADIPGDVFIEGHCLFYKPPPQTMFSIYVLGDIRYKATNAGGKSNEGTVTIKMV